MTKIAYQRKTFRKDSLARINQANEIIADYQAQGFNLTLRQLYYQFVSRGLIPNRQTEYKNLGTLISEARLAGLVDWEAITDRTRNLRDLAKWASPSAIISAVSEQYAEDLWRDQRTRVEVWIEKDALVGVIGGVCEELYLPYFSCRGYVSQSEMWAAAVRIINRFRERIQRTTILHLGDHDPSGIDMTRDITDRLTMFCEHHDAAAPEVRRIALTRDQIAQYNPPPNPAKMTDARAGGYVAEHGYESWELDALSPAVLADLIREEATGEIDQFRWEKRKGEETRHRELLTMISDDWDSVVEYMTEQ